jgi:hypothetical protein
VDHPLHDDSSALRLRPVGADELSNAEASEEGDKGCAFARNILTPRCFATSQATIHRGLCCAPFYAGWQLPPTLRLQKLISAYEIADLVQRKRLCSEGESSVFLDFARGADKG